MNETYRAERTELVILLDSLKDAKKESHKGDMYSDAIRQTRRKLLGLYRQVQNMRKPTESITDIITPLEIVVQ